MSKAKIISTKTAKTMRKGVLLLTLAILAPGLVACGRSSDQAQAPAAEMSPAPATPPSAAAKRLLAQLPAPYNHGDLTNGELHFHLCMSCHTIAQGAPDMTGPNLYGVFGRKVASKPGYAYSPALQAKSWTWDVQHLDGWLRDPRTYVPGTKMTFYGLRDDKDRIDTIAYLKVASSGGGS